MDIHTYVHTYMLSFHSCTHSLIHSFTISSIRSYIDINAIPKRFQAFLDGVGLIVLFEVGRLIHDVVGPLSMNAGFKA